MQQFSTLTADSMFVDVLVIMAFAQCHIHLTIQQAFSQLYGIYLRLWKTYSKNKMS